MHTDGKARGSSILPISKCLWMLLRQPRLLKGRFAARSVRYAIVQTLTHQIAYCMGFGVVIVR